MKAAVATIVKYLLWALLGTLLVLCIFGLTFAIGWPWWVGISLTLAVIALGIALWFLKLLLLRRKEQRSVQDSVEQDDAGAQTPAAAETSRHRELQLRWKEAIATLRRSHLRKQGNPLYVLPWYLMMGESGSGKSAAISSARLSSPFSTQGASGSAGTRNCDWWFFENAIFIDTAGRYAIPVEPETDNEEWQEFLTLLVKYRKAEPIQGLIVTVAADKLLSPSPETLEQDGLQLRRRLDQLMRVLGVAFPVYLLVTKLDLVPGMSRFFALLEDRELNQAMGVVRREHNGDAVGFARSAMTTIAERLKDLRIRLLQQEEGGFPPGALLFPDRFLGLGSAIESLVKAAFQENRYQETPVLRGIYFSSARQEGAPCSRFPNGVEQAGEQEPLPGSNRGLFLHDLFDKVLPNDRTVLAPTVRSLQWRALTRNLGLTSWVVLWVALCGLMSYSFLKNIATIRTASGVLAKAPQVSGGFRADIATMEQWRRMIQDVELQNRHWWVPRFWLDESLKVESALKAKYCREFRERFLVPFDREIGERISGFTSATPDHVAGDYLVHLTRRINMLKLRMEKGGEGVKGVPLPSYLLASQTQVHEPEQARKFGEQYLNYLLWRGDGSEMTAEISSLQALLKRIVAVKGAGLRWLPEWVNRQGLSPPITLQSFWGGSRSAAEEPAILPAFTGKGRESIASFQVELRQAYPDPASLEREQGDFDSWYRASCYTAWLRFATLFPTGAERLNGAKEWRAVAEVMPTGQGPYFAFFDRAASELAPLGPVAGMPPLLQQIIKFRLLKDAGVATGGAARAVQEGKKLSARVGGMLGQPGALPAPASGAAAAKACSEYRSALASIAPATKSRQQAYQMALQVFSEDPAVSKSPFYAAHRAAEAVKGELGGGRADEAFSRLATGPLSFLWSYVQKETACAIQTQWEEQVLREAQGGADPQMQQYLLGQEGPVWKFVNGSIGSFQGWAPGRGYYSKGALGGSVPFQPGFFTFLAKGTKAKVALARTQAVKQSYPVTIKGLPTDANDEARVKPQSTRLELQCATGAQTIENLNYPVSKTFTWLPDSCGEVSFQIEIGDLVLTRQYPGFPAFLKEFQGGRHTFYTRDFPREKGALERMGVRFIRPNYQFSGAQDVVAQGGGGTGSAVAGEIPRTITKCWE